MIWGLIIAFVLWLMQDLRSRPYRHHIASGASASEILDRRLATGEINAAEYQRLRTTLGQTPNEERPGTEAQQEPSPKAGQERLPQERWGVTIG